MIIKSSLSIQNILVLQFRSQLWEKKQKVIWMKNRELFLSLSIEVPKSITGNLLNWLKWSQNVGGVVTKLKSNLEKPELILTKLKSSQKVNLFYSMMLQYQCFRIKLHLCNLRTMSFLNSNYLRPHILVFYRFYP